jgi:hypothetical protein
LKRQIANVQTITHGCLSTRSHGSSSLSPAIR